MMVPLAQRLAVLWGVLTDGSWDGQSGVTTALHSDVVWVARKEEQTVHSLDVLKDDRLDDSMAVMRDDLWEV